MPRFDYDYTDKDYQLVAEQIDGVFNRQFDYMRIIVRSNQALDNTVALGNDIDGDGVSDFRQAVFYSSANSSPFFINVTPFIQYETSDIVLKEVGGNVGNNGYGGDFKIYHNEAEDKYYIKPNEVFRDFGLPQGSYIIQIDFLRQARPI